MKKILGISILSVLVLSFFAVPAGVSAKTCQEQCADSGLLGTNLEACKAGCSWQGSACYTNCDTSYPSANKPTENDACRKGCGLKSTGTDPTSPINDVAEIEGLVRWVARWIAIMVSVIAVIFIILGGVAYITAGGDAEKAKGARQKVVYGLIGLAIAALAWGAESIVRSVLSPK